MRKPSTAVIILRAAFFVAFVLSTIAGNASVSDRTLQRQGRSSHPSAGNEGIAFTTPASDIRAFQLVGWGQGWVLSQDKFLWTSSDGSEWHSIAPSNVAIENIRAAFFADVNHGWVVTTEPSSGQGSLSSAAVLHTGDGGETWSKSVLPLFDTQIPLHGGTVSVDFRDPEHGVVALQLPSSSAFSLTSVFATADGGITWHPFPAPAAGAIASISQQDAILVGGAGDDEVFITHDGGSSWKSVVVSGVQREPDFALHLILTSRHQPIIAIRDRTDSGLRLRFFDTADRGETWQEAPLQVPVTDGMMPLLSIGDSGYWRIVSQTECDRAGPCSRKSHLLSASETRVRDITPQMLSETAYHNTGSLRLEPVVQAAGSTPIRTSSLLGFDKSGAPSVAQMRTWWTQPSGFYEVGFYIGGNNYNGGNPDPAISTSWVSQVSTLGWGLMPIWVGPQSTCIIPPTPLPTKCQAAGKIWPSCYYNLITSPDSQGAADADSAILAADGLGLHAGSIIYYDLENYGPWSLSASSHCTASEFADARGAAGGLINAWVRQLHNRGYKAGVYANPQRLISDLGIPLANLADAAWVAGASSLNSNVWSQRIYQTKLNYVEPALGIMIDSDQAEGPVNYIVSPSTKFVINDAVTSGGMTVRDSPAGPANGTETAGAVGTIRNGPAYGLYGGNSYQWWLVEWPDKTGWSAEDFLNKVGQCTAGAVLAASTSGGVTTTACTPTAPNAPSALSATTISSTQINLSWTDNSSNETGFKVERKMGAGGTYAQIAAPGVNATSYQDMSVSCGTQYYYRVRATNSGIDSGYSNEANAIAVCSCTSFTINPSSMSPSSSASSQSVTITGSPSGCQGGIWNASGNGSWLTVSPSNGSGSGSTTVFWTQNPFTSSRSDSATIASRAFSVTQSGTTPPTCTSFTIDPSSSSASSAAGAQPVTISGSPTGCQGGSWNAWGNGSWLTVAPSNGNGPGSTTVFWSLNPLTSSRTDNASIAGRSYSVTQSAASGTGSGSPHPFIDVAGAAVQLHDIGVAPDGSVYVLYPTTSPTALAVVKSTDGGASWNSPVAIPNSNYTDLYHLAVDSSGVVHVVWGLSNGNTETYYSRSTNGGATFSSPIQVRTGNTYNGYRTNNSTEPVVASDGTGNVYVAYGAFTKDGGGNFVGYNVWVSQSTNGGTSFQPEFSITAISSTQKMPRKIRATPSNFYVLYMDETNYDLYLYRRNVGAASGNTGRLNTNASSVQYDGDFAVSPDEMTVYGTYSDTTGDTEGNITLCKSTDGGITWPVCRRVNDSSNRQQHTPRVGLDSLGHLHMAWADGRSNGRLQIYYAYSDDGGVTFSTNTNLSLPVTQTDFSQTHVVIDNPNSAVYVSATLNYSQVVVARLPMTPASQDTTAPVGSVIVNNGNSVTATTSVLLSLSASDAVGVVGYYVSNSSSVPSAGQSGWSPVGSTTSLFTTLNGWQVTAGDGVKTVYVWYKDAAGNVSTAASTTITLDTTPPTNGTLTAIAASGQIQLIWSGQTDSGSGLAAYKLVYANGSTAPADCSGSALATTSPYTHAGLANGQSYSYRLCTQDNAGNVSTGAAATAIPQAPAASGFYLLTPCRLIDTRNPAGPYGSPALNAGIARNVVVTGVCGIPSGVYALSVNVTATGAESNGWLTLFPGPSGTPIPYVSTINYGSGKTLANNAVVRVGTDGTINVYNSGPAAVHGIIDVNGYFK
jgi:hypothetical protein